MSIFRRRSRSVACQDFVERITDYLDGAVTPDERDRVDRHLRTCPGCTRALRQWRIVIDLAGRIDESDIEALDEPTRNELISAFVTYGPTG